MDTDARPQRARLVEDIAHADREDRDPQTPCGRDVAAPRQPERHVIENEEGRRREVARRRAGDAIRVPRLDPRLGAAAPRSGAADLRRALQPAAPPFALSASLHRWPNLRSPIPVDPHDVRRRACSVGSSTNTNESLRDGFGVSDPHGLRTEPRLDTTVRCASRTTVGSALSRWTSLGAPTTASPAESSACTSTAVSRTWLLTRRALDPWRPNDPRFGPDGLLYFTDSHNWEDLRGSGPQWLWRRVGLRAKKM